MSVSWRYNPKTNHTASAQSGVLFVFKHCYALIYPKISINMVHFSLCDVYCGQF
jgi:hypothetical protein